MSMFKFKKKLKLKVIALIALVLSVGVVPMSVMADGYDDPNAYIKEAKISNMTFYEDGSLKSFDIAITPACAADGYFSPETAHGAISLHTEKFGSSSLDGVVNEAPTGNMKYYLYNGTLSGGSDKYVWKDAIKFDDENDVTNDEKRDGYWENYLYKDYSCTEIASMTTSRRIYDLEWKTTDDGYPQDCYFVTWGLKEDGSANVIDLTVGESDYVTTETTMYFAKGKLIPSEPQKYYVYLWNQWTNDAPIEEGWYNPNGIYPERHICTFETGNGFVLEGVNDTLEITGETKVGQTLTANILDETRQDASSYWSAYTWRIDDMVVGEGLTYTVKAEDAGKSITFTCEGEKEGRTGLLMDTVTISPSETVPSPKTGDSASTMKILVLLGISAVCLIMATTAKLKKRISF